MSSSISGNVRGQERKIGAAEYVALHGFHGGETVKVIVGADRTEYVLPKQFLCDSSEYFRVYFQMNSRTGENEIYKLDAVEPKYFDYLIHWIGARQVVLEENSALRFDPEMKPSDYALYQITEYLELLLIAHKLFIEPSPAVLITDKMRGLMARFPDDDLLNGELIQRAWSLPSKHPVRKLFIEAAIEDYIFAYFSPDYTIEDFILVEELKNLPEFALAMIRYASGFVKKQVSKEEWKRGEHKFLNPVTRKSFRADFVQRYVVNSTKKKQVLKKTEVSKNWCRSGRRFFSRRAS